MFTNILICLFFLLLGPVVLGILPSSQMKHPFSWPITKNCPGVLLFEMTCWAFILLTFIELVLSRHFLDVSCNPTTGLTIADTSK